MKPYQASMLVAFALRLLLALISRRPTGASAAVLTLSQFLYSLSFFNQSNLTFSLSLLQMVNSFTRLNPPCFNPPSKLLFPPLSHTSRFLKLYFPTYPPTMLSFSVC